MSPQIELLVSLRPEGRDFGANLVHVPQLDRRGFIREDEGEGNSQFDNSPYYPFFKRILGCQTLNITLIVLLTMIREKGKRKGVRKYRPKSFSIDIPTLYRMEKYTWISFSPIVSKLLASFLDKLDEQDVSDPTKIIDRLLGDSKEDPK